MMAEEYAVCEGETASALADAVNARLADGWELAGGVHVLSYPWNDDFFRCYTQAMLRRTGKD